MIRFNIDRFRDRTVIEATVTKEGRNLVATIGLQGPHGRSYEDIAITKPSAFIRALSPFAMVTFDHGYCNARTEVLLQGAAYITLVIDEDGNTAQTAENSNLSDAVCNAMLDFIAAD